MHNLELVQPDIMICSPHNPPSPPQGYAQCIENIQRVLQTDKVIAQVRVMSSSSIGSASKVPVRLGSIGPQMFQFEACIGLPCEQPHPDLTNPAACEIELSASNNLTMKLTAKGPIRDIGESRWPVYIHSDSAPTQRLSMWHVAWLIVSWAADVPKDKLSAAKEWFAEADESKIQESKSVRYMWSLGEAVGKEVAGEIERSLR